MVRLVTQVSYWTSPTLSHQYKTMESRGFTLQPWKHRVITLNISEIVKNLSFKQNKLWSYTFSYIMTHTPPKKVRITVYNCQWDFRAQIPQQRMKTLAPDPNPLIWQELCTYRLPKCKAKQQSVYFVVLPSVSVYIGICWWEERRQRERPVMFIFLILDSAWLSTVSTIHTQFYVNCITRAHLKLANQWHTFPWPVTQIPQECHSDVTKVKDAPLQYDRTDSGEACLKCVVATSMLNTHIILFLKSKTNFLRTSEGPGDSVLLKIPLQCSRSLIFFFC